MSLSGAAFAQNSVTLSGIIKGGLASTKYSNSATATDNGSGLGLSDGSSRFIISGTEDLGGGMAGHFQVDTRFRVDDNGGAPTSSPLAGGNTWVGVRGAFGDVRLGKLDTHYCLGADSHGTRATALQASSCALIGYINASSGVGSVAVGSRSANSVRYTTPSISGFTAEVSYSTSPTSPEGTVSNPGKGSAMGLTARYGKGPLSLGGSIYSSETEDRSQTVARTDQSSTEIWGSYNLGIVAIGLTYNDSANDNAAANSTAFAKTKRNAWSIPVTAPVGKGTVLFTYTRANDTETGGTNDNNSGANLMSIGYDYDLGKRTKLGFSYARLDNKSAGLYRLYTQAALAGTNPGAAAAGLDQSQVYIGLRHTF
ncbi:MAG: hypothetical protein RI906_1071 [Pseudomonadota bacterium]